MSFSGSHFSNFLSTTGSCCKRPVRENLLLLLLLELTQTLEFLEHLRLFLLETTGPGQSSTLSADLSAISSASRAHTDSRATRLHLLVLLERVQLLRHRRFLFCSRWLRPLQDHPAARHVTCATPARYEPTLVLHGLSKESSGFTLSV